MTERIAAHPRERERVALVSSRILVTLNFYVVTTRSDATRLTIAVRACVRVTRATRAFDGLSRRSSLRPSDVSVVASHVFEPRQQ